MKPLVSIIILTYNHQEYLEDCINSVIAQTYTQWEAIIIDDGSTDNTLKIGEQLAATNNNIHFTTQDNVGPFKMHLSYNKALKMCKGKFIAILDGDDYWYSNKLDKQITALNTNPNAILCWSGADSRDDFTKDIIRSHPKSFSKDYYNKPQGAILKHLYKSNCIPALTIVVKNESLEKIGGFKNLADLPLVDYPTLLELSLLGEFAFINESLGAWRIYPNQVTKSFTVNIRKGLFTCASTHYSKNKSHASIGNIDWKEMEINYTNELLIAYARSGRYKLIRKDYKGARADYKNALITGVFINMTWKLRSLIGYVFSFLHLDVEWLAKLLNKPAYKK